MRPPRHVQVGPVRYRVRVSQKAIDEAPDPKRVGQLMGSTILPQARIAIDPDLHPDVMADTFLHELLHALMDVTGANGVIDEDTEEDLVCRLSPALLDLLRRNPKVVAYLAP